MRADKAVSINVLTDSERESFRGRIKLGQIIQRLNRCALGEDCMRASELAAAKILLDKSLPSLASISVDSGQNTDIHSLPTADLIMLINAMSLNDHSLNSHSLSQSDHNTVTVQNSNDINNLHHDHDHYNDNANDINNLGGSSPNLDKMAGVTLPSRNVTASLQSDKNSDAFHPSIGEDDMDGIDDDIDFDNAIDVEFEESIVDGKSEELRTGRTIPSLAQNSDLSIPQSHDKLFPKVDGNEQLRHVQAKTAPEVLFVREERPARSNRKAEDDGNSAINRGNGQASSGSVPDRNRQADAKAPPQADKRRQNRLDRFRFNVGLPTADSAGEGQPEPDSGASVGGADDRKPKGTYTPPVKGGFIPPTSKLRSGKLR